MYTSYDFKTKEDLADTVKAGKKVTLFQPKSVRRYLGKNVALNGTFTVMGPHIKLASKDKAHGTSPKEEEVKVHTWFATVVVKDGVVKEVM